MIDSLFKVGDAQALALAIVNTIHEPLIVLDADLRVMAASRSFHETFKVDPDETCGVLLYALGDGQWDIPALRTLLETVIQQRSAMDEFEVTHDFPQLGLRTMLLNARMVIYQSSDDKTILLAITDITARRAIERDKAELLAKTEELVRQKQVLLQEMEHRVANSLQIIASILLMKARGVTSEETRNHLQDAHQRVMSVAAVQSHLHASASAGVELIEVGTYLTQLCSSLAASMIGEHQPIILKVTADGGLIDSAQAVSIGLIVTELVINALKYAFPEGRADALVSVTYESDKSDWTLMVTDNGVGKSENDPLGSVGNLAGGGLGAVIVRSLAKQLGARLDVIPSKVGYGLAITRTAFPSNLPQAA